jgi:Na+/H+-dicarboxylate symporter
VEGIGILIALDLVVDMFITVGNVTADVTAAIVLTRADRAGGVSGQEPPSYTTSPPTMV